MNKEIESIKIKEINFVQKPYHEGLKIDDLRIIEHEIRTPLNSIIGFSELLNTIGLGDDERKEYLNHIIKSGYDLLNFTNGLIIRLDKVTIKE